MSEISNMILRMRELAVQMENGIYTSKDRDNAQLEINALLQEIDKIAVNTRFNDVNLLDGNYDQSIRAGNTNAETIRVAIDGLKTTGVANINAYAREKGVDNSTTVTTGLDTKLRAREATEVSIDTSLFSATFKEIFKNDSLGDFTLTNTYNDGNDALSDNRGIDNNKFNIDTKTGRITSKQAIVRSEMATNAGTALFSEEGDLAGAPNSGILRYNGADVAAATAHADNKYQIEVTYTTRGTNPTVHKELITLQIDAAVDDATTTLTGTQLDDIQVESQAEATRAVETLDKALGEVSSAQAKLGAIQNRLQHNIDNLSKGAMLTEQAVGRVVDADFASETSSLSKQQILNQAATAMLAQANQSKQSVLSLLQ
jgi:flagellin